MDLGLKSTEPTKPTRDPAGGPDPTGPDRPRRTERSAAEVEFEVNGGQRGMDGMEGTPEIVQSISLFHIHAIPKKLKNQQLMVLGAD